MPQKVAVVIPTYKEELTELEKISLAQVRKVLGNYLLIFIAPQGKTFSCLKRNDLIAQFPPYFFQTAMTYNRLLMSPKFYEVFSDYEYILIYQLDAFVFYDSLEFFCSLGYDYIGAPVAYHSWYTYKYGNKIPRVGNGGFSLRKVKSCQRILTELLTECGDSSNWQHIQDNFFEDSFFGMCGVMDDVNFKTAPVEIAVRFAVDYFPDRFLRRIGNKVPFGCHGWSKYSADAYVKLFAQAGYDLRPYRDKMDNKDYGATLKFSLEAVALSRLIRGIERGQSALQYLPTKNFASVCVIRHKNAMKILARLIQEANFFTDKIFIYDEAEAINFIRDIAREDLPHLVLSFKDDDFFINFTEGRELIYGRHIISFRREYLKQEEKLFCKLGK